jgi:hypothetical protein
VWGWGRKEEGEVKDSQHERKRRSKIVNTNERVKIARKNRDLKRLSYNWRPGPRPFKKKKRRKKNMVNDVKKKDIEARSEGNNTTIHGRSTLCKGKENRLRKKGTERRRALGGRSPPLLYFQRDEYEE